MKKVNYFVMIALLAFMKISAQTIQRGMYVDNFLTLDSSNFEVSSWTILGDQTQEDNLLNYAQGHNFKYLALYDLDKVFNLSVSALNNKDYQHLLALFIYKAKHNYGIEEIGAVGDMTLPHNIATYNWGANYEISYNNCILSADTPSNPLPDVEQPVDDEWSPSIAMLNLFSKIYNYNLEYGSADSVGRLYPVATIDVFSIELEFWTDSSADTRVAALGDWEFAASNMQCINLNAPYPLIIETEMTLLDGTNTKYAPTYTDTDVANIIDRYANRILLDSYHNNVFALEGMEESSLHIFDQNTIQTNFCPLFSAEDTLFAFNPYHPCSQQPCWNDYLGNWLLGNSLDSAEAQYNRDYNNSTSTNTKDFFMYFTYSLLNENGIGTINKLKNNSNENEFYISDIIVNPSNKSTTIDFILPDNYSSCSLEVIDINGKQVFKNQVIGKGKGSYTIDEESIQSGIYFCHLTLDGMISNTKKLVIIH